MKPTEIAKLSDSYTDEMVMSGQVLHFFNGGISFINTELSTNLPMTDNAGQDYTALSDSWLNQIVGNYISWGIKMQDGSLNEAREYKDMFMRAILALEDVMYGPNDDGSGGAIAVEFLDPEEIAKRAARMDTFVSSWFGSDFR